MASPVTVADVPVTVALPPAGLEVTVYVVMALPPFDAGAVHETEADALPACAVTPAGAPGAVTAAAESFQMCPTPTSMPRVVSSAAYTLPAGSSARPVTETKLVA